MSPAERLKQLETGENPALILKMESGFAVMAENQYLLGYCLLLASPLVGQMADLPAPNERAFLTDMARLGRAVKAVTSCARVNFGIYGNVDPFLHAHVWPRYADEPDERRSAPPLTFAQEVLTAPASRFDPSIHGDLMAQLRSQLSAR